MDKQNAVYTYNGILFIEMGSRMLFTRAGGCGEKGACYLVGTEFQICKIKEFWRFASQQYEYT